VQVFNSNTDIIITQSVIFLESRKGSVESFCVATRLHGRSPERQRIDMFFIMSVESNESQVCVCVISSNYKKEELERETLVCSRRTYTFFPSKASEYAPAHGFGASLSLSLSLLPVFSSLLDLASIRYHIEVYKVITRRVTFSPLVSFISSSVLMPSQHEVRFWVIS
jgi:NADH:ubiquinone oxidoreductase subunit K